MTRQPGIRVYFQKEAHYNSAHPHNRYGSVWISPDRDVPLPIVPENVSIKIDNKAPQEGYARHIEVNGLGRDSLHLRQNESGEWEFHGGQGVNARSNGNLVDPYQWHPFDNQLISAFISPQGHSRYNSYSFNAELDPDPLPHHPPCAIANRLVELGLEPKKYHSLIIVPGAKIQVEQEQYTEEGRKKTRVIRNPENNRINLHLSELIRLRVREGLRQLALLHLKGINAALAFSGGKLHYYERDPIEGMRPEDIAGKTEASLMQEYMAKVLSSKEEFEKWLDETPEKNRNKLPKTLAELVALLGGNVRQMIYTDNFAQDALGNALGVRMEVVEPRDGRRHFKPIERHPSGYALAEEVPKRGEEFADLKRVHLIIENPFKSRFMQHVRDEFKDKGTTAHVPPESEEVAKILQSRYMDEHLKAMREQGRKYIEQNQGKPSYERAEWLAKNHAMYAHLRPKPLPKRPRNPTVTQDVITVMDRLWKGTGNMWRTVIAGFRNWRNRGRPQPDEESPPEGEDRPPQPPQG